MKTVATIKLKIPARTELTDLLRTYRDAVAYIADLGHEKHVHNRYDLHHLCYYDARKRFPLPSQFIINAIRVASQALKSSKKGSKPQFKATLPLPFDKRTFTFQNDRVRLTVLNGRIDIPIDIPEYYWKYLDWSPQTADLVMKDNKLFLHVTFRREITLPKPTGTVLGVDLGITNLAVTSSGEFFNAQHVKKQRRMFQRLRTKLQAKGTRSAKRHLRKLRGREQRFMAWVNHSISKEIVSSLDAGATIVLENLRNIRKQRRGRRMNFWLHRWNFSQLQQFITYKAAGKGVTIAKVDPRYTSKICSRCGTLGSRSSSFFSCPCGYTINADLNASRNLARRHSMPDGGGVAVNQPNISNDDAEDVLELGQNLGITVPLRNAQG